MIRRARPVASGLLSLALAVAALGLIGCSAQTAGLAVDAGGPNGGPEQAAPTSAPGEQDAPIQLSDRWWRSPSVDEVKASDEPRLAAAVDVLDRYFGSHDAREMTAVSVEAAYDFARFMAEMQQLAAAHPMEEVTVWTNFEIVSDDDDGLLVDGRLSEDRATGSGQVERSIFEQFRLVEGPDGDLLLADFTRNDVPIAHEVLASDHLPGPAGEDAGVSIEAVQRSSIGVLLVAGRVSAAESEPAEIVADDILLFDPEPHQPRFVDSRVAEDGQRYFLLSFPDMARTDQGVTLQLATATDDDPEVVTFKFSAW